MTRTRSVLSTAFALLTPLFACDSEPTGEAGEDTETGGDDTPSATLVVEAGQAALCGEFGGPIQIMARRVDCFDPVVPCTVAQDPPWILGTAGDCSLGDNPTRWEVVVTQNGRWETRIEAEGVGCYAQAGGATTAVSRDDLDNHTEYTLSPGPADSCGE